MSEDNKCEPADKAFKRANPEVFSDPGTSSDDDIQPIQRHPNRLSLREGLLNAPESSVINIPPQPTPPPVQPFPTEAQEQKLPDEIDVAWDDEDSDVIEPTSPSAVHASKKTKYTQTDSNKFWEYNSTQTEGSDEEWV